MRNTIKKLFRKLEPPLPPEPSATRTLYHYSGMTLRSGVLDSDGDLFTLECLQDMAVQAPGKYVTWGFDSMLLPLGKVKSAYVDERGCLLARFWIESDKISFYSAINYLLLAPQMVYRDIEQCSGMHIIKKVTLMSVGIVPKHIDPGIISIYSELL